MICMKNSEILVKSLSEWATGVIETIQKASGDSMLGIVGSLVSPELLAGSLMRHVAAPYLQKVIGKIQDDAIPGLTAELIDGMIEKRVQDGRLDIPFLGIGLGQDAFRNLKSICEGNFLQYGEQGKVNRGDGERTG